MSKHNHLEAKKRHSGVRERLASNESRYSSRHWSIVLTKYRLFSSQILCTTRVGILGHLRSTNFQSIQLTKTSSTELTLQKKKLIKICFQGRLFFDKKLSCLRIEFSNSQTWILDCVENGVLSSDLAQKLRQKTADVHDIYFTLLDAAWISPILVLTQNAKTKERVSWVLFKVWTSEAAKITCRVVLLVGLCAF